VSKSPYDVVIGKLLEGLAHPEDTKDQAEARALDAEAIFGSMLSMEEKIALAFISGVRWKERKEE